MAGVQTQVDVGRVGGLEKSLDVGLVADVAVGVGVELGVDAVLLEHPFAEVVVALVSAVHCSAVSWRGSFSLPVRSSRHRSGMTTMCSAPMAAVREAIGAICFQTSSMVSGCCSRAKVVPPDTLRPPRAELVAQLAGSVGR